MITQIQNMITYQGRKYRYTFDLTTREADGDVQIVMNRKPKNALELLVQFYMNYPNADGFYETLIKNVYRNYDIVSESSYWYTLNDKIADIKKHYHQMQKWATENDVPLKTPSALLRALNCYTFTPMEYDFYCLTGVTNKEVLTKYAYQFQKYHKYLNICQLQTKIDTIIATDGKFEKPSSILDFLLKINQRYDEIKDIYLHQQMQKYYEKNKKYEFTDGTYIYTVPSTVQQVKNEAEMQNNCLYDSYLSRMTDDSYSNVIICVRDINNPTESLYTIEYMPTEKCFKQCYRQHNQTINKVIADYLLIQIIGRE